MKTNKLGIIFSVAVTIGLVLAAMWWYKLFKPVEISADEIKTNIQNTFLNLQAISKAQSEYIKTDWDNDGKKVFAKFYIHLWRSVSLQGDPIDVGLIPKKLAFAIEPARAINSYYFIDLHDKDVGDGQLQSLDYEKYWAILAMQPNENQKEALYFLADYTGNVYAKYAKYVPQQYPADAISDGWTKILTINQLRDFIK